MPGDHVIPPVVSLAVAQSPASANTVRLSAKPAPRWIVHRTAGQLRAVTVREPKRLSRRRLAVSPSPAAVASQFPLAARKAEPVAKPPSHSWRPEPKAAYRAVGRLRDATGLARDLGRRRLWQEAIAILDDLRSGPDSVEPDIIARCAVASACAGAGRWQQAEALLHETVSSMLEPDGQFYNVVISACEKGRVPARAVAALSEAQACSVKPDVIAHNAAISAWAAVARWPCSLDILQIAIARGMAATPVTAGAVVRALALGHKWESVFKELREAAFVLEEAGVVTYSAAISALEGGEHWARALDLLHDSRVLAMESDRVACMSAIGAFAKGGLWEDALEAFEGALGSGVVFDRSAFNTAVTAADRGKNWQLALSLMRPAEARGIDSDVITRNAATSACAGCGAWEAALVVLWGHSAIGINGFNAAISACEKGKQWRRAFELLSSVHAFRVEADEISYNTAVLACLQARSWPFLDSLLDYMVAGRVELDMNLYGDVLTAFEQGSLLDRELSLLLHLGLPGFTLVAGPDLAACAATAAAARLAAVGRSEDAAARLEAAADSRSAPWSAADAAMLAALRPRVAAPAVRAMAVRSAFGPYGKELCLLARVMAEATPGAPALACKAVEAFGADLSPMWLKIAGGRKAATLAAAVRAAPAAGNERRGGRRGGSRGVLEIGCYCGYSALRMAAALPEVHIDTLEVDPVHVVVARNMIAFAGLNGRVEVWTGHSTNLVPRLADHRSNAGLDERLPYSALFMDQKGSLFHKDLAALEDRGLLLVGATIVADNVLKPGAPLFLWRVAGGKPADAPARYLTQVVRVAEFAMPAEDWMSVSTWLESDAAASVPAKSSVRLLQLDVDADAMRDAARSAARSVSFARWASFAAEMRGALGEEGIAATATADGAEAAAAS